MPSLQSLLCFQVGKQTKRLLCWFLEWSWATCPPPQAITRVQGLFWNNLAASPSVGEVVVLLQCYCKAFSRMDDRDPWQSFCLVHWAGATPIWGGQRTRARGRRAWELGRPQWPAWLCVCGLGLVLPPGLFVWPAEDSQAWESQVFPRPGCQWALKSRAEDLLGWVSTWLVCPSSPREAALSPPRRVDLYTLGPKPQPIAGSQEQTHLWMDRCGLWIRMDERGSPSSGTCLPVTPLSSAPGGPCLHWGLWLLTPFGLGCKNPLGGGGGSEGTGPGMLPGSGQLCFSTGGLLPLQPCCSSLLAQAFVSVLQSFWAPGAPCSPPNLVNPPSLILPKLLCWGPWLLLGLTEMPRLYHSKPVLGGHGEWCQGCASAEVWPSVGKLVFNIIGGYILRYSLSKMPKLPHPLIDTRWRPGSANL